VIAVATSMLKIALNHDKSAQLDVTRQGASSAVKEKILPSEVFETQEETIDQLRFLRFDLWAKCELRFKIVDGSSRLVIMSLKDTI
jgi:hypothetical protein